MKRRFLLFALINTFLIIICFTCKYSTDSNSTENKMYVYSNSGYTFYLVDYKTFKVIKEIHLPTSNSVSYGGMMITTNRDYLFFAARRSFPDSPWGFAVYNIANEKLDNLFFIELNYGISYFISAENKSEPGLIYVHSRDFGTYLIDLFEQKVVELISDEHYFHLDKRIYHSPEEKWDVVKKTWRSTTNYTELEFYTANSNLHDLQFVLNKENEDSLLIYDFEFSNDNRLFITFLPGPRGEECNFGSYNLATKQLYRSSLEFPWSLNPYYTAYSPCRDEIYTIGAYDTLYIIDTDTYEVKDKITLTGKIAGPSRILITADENIAFVSCSNSDAIFVIELDNRQVINTISITHPYNMIIP